MHHTQTPTNTRTLAHAHEHAQIYEWLIENFTFSYRYWGGPKLRQCGVVVKVQYRSSKDWIFGSSSAFPFYPFLSHNKYLVILKANMLLCSPSLMVIVHFKALNRRKRKSSPWAGAKKKSSKVCEVVRPNSVSFTSGIGWADAFVTNGNITYNFTLLFVQPL